MPEKPPDRAAVLHPAEAAQHYALKQYHPAPDLAAYVEHAWVVRWRLPAGVRYPAEILPHPSVNLSFTGDPAAARITGVPTKKFTYALSGAGVALGVRFTAGGFQPFFGRSVAELTGRTLPVSAVFDLAAVGWDGAPRLADSDADLVARAEALLRLKAPAPDPHLATIQAILDRLHSDPALTQVRAVAAAFGLRPRTLQHLFRTYVGVGVKWIINRYRLHEAAVAISQGHTDFARLAHDLGYTDQSHFTRDFKRFIGVTPAVYAAREER
jgi:AraC-like DNA-binding protein